MFLPFERSSTDGHLRASGESTGVPSTITLTAFSSALSLLKWRRAAANRSKNKNVLLFTMARKRCHRLYNNCCSESIDRTFSSYLYHDLFHSRYFTIHFNLCDTSSASDDLTSHSLCTINFTTNGLIMLMTRVRLVILFTFISLLLASHVTTASTATSATSVSSADHRKFTNATFFFTPTFVTINSSVNQFKLLGERSSQAHESNRQIFVHSSDGMNKVSWNETNGSFESIDRRSRALRGVKTSSMDTFSSPLTREATAKVNSNPHAGYNVRDSFHKSLLLQQQQGREQLSPSICQFVFNSSVQMSGNFSSPGWMSGSYPPNTRCTYLFIGSRYQVLNVTFHTFQLESPFAKGCLKDYIDISTVTAFNVKRLIGRFCGRRVPSPIISMHPTAEIIFKSDHVIAERGFFASYTFLDESSVGVPDSTVSRLKGCGGVQEGSGGVIESPNFPSAFPNSIDCMWVIRVKQNQHIYVNLLELQLFGSIANCKESQLSVYDGYENYDFSPKEPKKFCGDLRYYKGIDDKVDLSSDNRLLIRFRADVTHTQWKEQLAGRERVGFRLVWTAIDFTPKEECQGFLCESSEYCLQPRSLSGCSENSRFFCIDPTLVCDGVPNCSEQDLSDEDKCSLPFFIALSGVSLIFVSIIGAICYYCCYCRNKSRSTRASTSDQSMIHHNPSQIASVKGSISECDNLSSIDGNKSATVTLTNAGVDALSAAQLNPSPTTLAKLQQLHHHNHSLSQYNQFQHQILHDQQHQLLLHQLQPITSMAPVSLQGPVYQLYSSDDSSKYITYTGMEDNFNEISTFNSGTLKLLPKHMLVIDPTCPAHSTLVSSTLPRAHRVNNVPPTDAPISSELITMTSTDTPLTAHLPLSCQLPTLNCLVHQKEKLDEQENISQGTVTEEDESTEHPASSLAASVHSTNETDAGINAAAAETAASAFALYELMSCKNVFY